MKIPTLYRRGLLLLSPFLVSTMTASFAAAQTAPINNFRQVGPGIFAGANPIDGISGDDAFKTLLEHSVKIDIDLQGSDVKDAQNFVYKLFNQANEPGERDEMISHERELAKSAGMEFVNLSINSNNPISSAEAKKIDEILDLLSKASPTDPVYLHCEHGADRTGLVIALFRVLRQGQNIDEAYEEWERNGHTAAARVMTGQLDVYFCSKALAIASSYACGERI
jgi:hypothetical protein